MSWIFQQLFPSHILRCTVITMQVPGILEHISANTGANIRKHMQHAFDATNMQHSFQSFLLTFYIIFKMASWVKLNFQYQYIDLLHFHRKFRSNKPDWANPKSHLLTFTNSYTKKSHSQALVERTFAGKTTCDPISRLGGLDFLNQTFNMENPRGHFAVICFVEYPKMLDIFLWKWYLFENCWDIWWSSPNLFFWVWVFWETHTAKIWKTGLRNPLSPNATPAPTLRIHMIPMVGGCLRFPWLKDVELLLLVTTVPRYFGVLSPWLLVVEIQNIKCARNGRPNNHRGYTPKEMMIWNRIMLDAGFSRYDPYAPCMGLSLWQM